MATDTLTSINHRTTLTVGATAIPGPWKTFSGGGLTGESLKNKPGGMEQEESIPTPSTREAVTITREYKVGRDSGLVGPGGFLETAKKRGDTFYVTRQDLDHAGRPVGAAKVFHGTCDGVSESDRDSEGNEIHTLTVVVGAVA